MPEMPTILIADAVSPAAVEVLRSEPGWNVIVSSPKEYAAHLAEAHALLVRSAVTVTADVIAAAPKLRVIGRAGVGVDNVDQQAATARGVVVMNTPGGNAISVAEHTMALILALARAVPAASASTKAGKWEKKKFLGNEINGKTLGIVGLGNIGSEVARRARPFGMNLLAHDPFVSPELAKDRGIELVELDELYARSDFITLHLSLTDETREMLNAGAFAKMKNGVRIINCARGELIDTDALVAALDSGRVGGAGLDVFGQEPPPPDSPLLKFENLVATPHIGGSTEEAQEKIGIRIAQQVRDYLRDGVVMHAVNMPSVSAEQYGKLAPYLRLAERMGSFVAQIAEGGPTQIEITYSGDFGKTNSSLIRNAALSGVMNRFLSEPANLINAMQVAADRAISVSENRESRRHFNESLSLTIQTAEGRWCAEGTVFPDGSPRLISAEGIYVEAPLDGNLVFLKNNDVPGVIGELGSVLGNAGINIADFSLGRHNGGCSPTAPGIAVAVVRTDQALPKEVLEKLEKIGAVQVARAVSF